MDNHLVVLIIIGGTSILALTFFGLFIYTWLRLKQLQASKPQADPPVALENLNGNPDQDGIYDEYQIYNTERVYQI